MRWMRPKRCSRRLGFHGQVVVHHQVRALQVDALAGGVGGEQDLHLGVEQEALLRLAPLLAPHPAVDQDHRVLAAEQGADLALEVGERVPVLGEDDDLLARRRDRLRDGACAVGDGRLADAVCPGPPGVKISPSSADSSRHLVSCPLRRTSAASASRRASVAISILSSASDAAAVAWSRIVSSASSTSFSGASSRSSTSSASSSGPASVVAGAGSAPPRWRSSSSRSRFSRRSRRRRSEW